MLCEIMGLEALLRRWKCMPDAPPSEYSNWSCHEHRHDPFTIREIGAMRTRLKAIAPNTYASLFPEEKAKIDPPSEPEVIVATVGQCPSDFEILRSFCRRVDAALARQDKNRAWALMEATRCLASVALPNNPWQTIEAEMLGVEAAMANTLWEEASRYGERFTAAVEEGIRAARSSKSKAG